MNDTPTAPLWTDVELASQVTSYAVELIDEYWNDFTLIGILDNSFLGEAVIGS